MKRICLLLLTSFFVVSCSSSLPKKIDRLADRAEAKGAGYSLEQWEQSNEQLEEFVEEYLENYGSYSPAERKEINRALARYSAAAVKSGAHGVASEVESFLDDIPDVIDEFVDGAKTFLQELGL